MTKNIIIIYINISKNNKDINFIHVYSSTSIQNISKQCIQACSEDLKKNHAAHVANQKNNIKTMMKQHIASIKIFNFKSDFKVTLNPDLKINVNKLK